MLGRGYYIPSPAGLGHNHDRLRDDIDAVVEGAGLEVVRFAKGETKGDRARPYQDAAESAGAPGVVLVGKAQEKMAAWTGYKDKASPLGSDGHPHFAFSRQSKVPDHWYFSMHDQAWGPAMVKLCPFAPYPLWIMANGHEWLKRQLTAAGVEYVALDNGLRCVDDPALAHRLAAQLSAGHLRSAIDRWLSWIPSPLVPADRRAGFSYDFSIRQLEISDTAVFDAPRRGRAWFEAAIRDHLDLGRPEQVALVVDRTIQSGKKHPTPGRFATEIIAADVNPKLQIHYKSSKAKCYLKEGGALRVETTVNNAEDFDTLKTLNATNWRALRRIGVQVNARFLAALGEGQGGVPDPAALESVVMPTIHDGQRAPGLRAARVIIPALTDLASPTRPQSPAPPAPHHRLARLRTRTRRPHQRANGRLKTCLKRPESVLLDQLDQLDQLGLEPAG